MEGTRRLELSHAEIELINQALTIAYFEKLNTVRGLRKEHEKSASEIVLKTANKYGDLQNEIENGEKDV